MKGSLSTAIKILLLAAAYYGTGKLSMLLAIPPGFATPVWPAAGVALAAVLLGGYRLLPGVFIGSFATNLLIASQGGVDINALRPVLIGSGIAFGAVLQAALGAYLVKRVLTIPTALNALRDVIALLLRGGVIGCLVNSSLGPLVLLMAGIIPGGVYLVSAVTWWVGDVIGVVLFAPMLLLLANVAVSNMRKAIVSLPLLVFAAITVFVFLNARDAVQELRIKEFEKNTLIYTASLKRTIRQSQDILKSIKRFYAASRSVGREGFSAFTEDILREHPSIRALEWIPRISHAEKSRYEALARQEGFPDFIIKEQDQEQFVPVSARPEYFPVYYVVPHEENEKAFGFDLGSDPERLKALAWARDNGRQAATSAITLVQGTDEASGFLLFEPVYQGKERLATPQARREGLRGFALGVFDIPELVEDALEDVRRDDIALHIHEAGAPGETPSLYGVADKAAPFSSRVPLKVANHQWVLEFVPSAESIVADQGWDLWYLLTGGLLFSAAFGVFLIFISAGTEAMQREVEREEAGGMLLDFSICARMAGGASALLGLVVLLGWHTHWTALIQVHPSFAPMQYNTALGFLLSGIGVAALSWGGRKTTLLCGMGVGIVGLLTLMQYALGVDLGIDQLLMRHYVTTQTSHPGRMAPNTALCFSLTGISLIVGFYRGNVLIRSMLLRTLGSFVLLLAAVAFIGYLTELETAYGWTTLTRMAVHTAAGFIVLGAGMTVYSWLGKSLRWEGRSAFWISGLVSALVMLFSLALWQQFQTQEGDLTRRVVKEESGQVVGRIARNVHESMMALRRMARRWGNQGGLSKEAWLADAQLYVQDFAALTAVKWVDDTHRVRWIEPSEGADRAISLNPTNDERFVRALKDAAKEDAITLSSSLDWMEGNRAVVCYVPIYVEGRFDGFMAGVYDTAVILRNVLSDAQAERLNIQVKDGEKTIFENARGNAFATVFTLVEPLNLFNRTWSITISPKAALLDAQRSFLPEMALLGGALVSLLIGFVVYTAMLSIRRNRLLKNKAAALNDSEEQYRVVVENAVDGLITIDAYGIIERFNPACEAIFGYQAKELLGENIKLLMPEPHQSKHDDYLQDYRHSGKKKIIGMGREVEGKKKDGTVFPMDISVSEVHVGGRTLFCGIIRDISERKKVEAEIIRSNLELERFAYIASHDLQEPLRMVSSFTKLLHEEYGESLDEQARQYMQFAVKGADNMQGLISDLLEYSRIGSEGVVLSEFDSKRVIDEILDEFKDAILEAGAEISIERMPPLYGNEAQFARLMRNLIGNALKYRAKERRAEIHVGLREHEEGWLFSVRDNGIGIKKAYLDQIFVLFKRLHGDNEYSGTGIGLAVCRRIVENCGGKLWAESIFGEGTTFYFILPQRETKATSALGAHCLPGTMHA